MCARPSRPSRTPVLIHWFASSLTAKFAKPMRASRSAIDRLLPRDLSFYDRSLETCGDNLASVWQAACVLSSSEIWEGCSWTQLGCNSEASLVAADLAPLCSGPGTAPPPPNIHNWLCVADSLMTIMRIASQKVIKSMCMARLVVGAERIADHF